MVTSCESQPSLCSPACPPAPSLINPVPSVINRVRHPLSKLWDYFGHRAYRMELRQLNKHLLKDINQPEEDIDPLRKNRAWNDPLYVEIRRRW